MLPGYEELVWIYDKEGNEYACPVEAVKGKVKKSKELTEEEKRSASILLR